MKNRRLGVSNKNPALRITASLLVALFAMSGAVAAPGEQARSGLEDAGVRCGLEFNGKDTYVDLGKTGLLEGVDELTLSHWVYFTSHGGGWRRTIATSEKVVRIHTRGRKFHFNVADADGNWTDHAISNSRFPLNEWGHVTAVYDGSDSIIYVNGNEAGRTDIGSVTTTTPGARLGFSAGRRDGALSPKNGFHGLMRGVRMYDRALSSEEVTRLYRGKNVSDGLVGWWPMNACEGNRVQDRSGNNNHGKIIKAKWRKAIIPSLIRAASSEQIVSTLLDLVKTHPESVVRTQAVKGLGALNVKANQVQSVLQEARASVKNVKEVRPAVLLAVQFYRNNIKKASDQSDSVRRKIVPLLLDVLKDGKYADEARQSAQDILGRLDDQSPGIKLAHSFLDLLANSKDSDVIRRAVLDGAGVMNVFKGDIDRGAEHPLPEIPEEIAKYKTHVQKKFHREISLYPKTVTRISTLSELSKYAGKSGVHVRMEPGVYEVTVDNYEHIRRQKKVLFHFTGSSSAFDLRGVEIKTDSSLPVRDVQINGSRLSIQGLTITNVGEEPGGSYTMVVKGADNFLKGMRVYARGSYPYGYMQAREVYRKLARPGHISRMSKNAAVIMGGDSCVVVDVEIYQRGNGHALSWSGDVDYTFINCLVEGKVRMSDDILDRTEGGFYADMENLSKKTLEEMNNLLSPGQVVPLAEDAYRSYGREGETLKVLGGAVKNMRNAFKRGTYDTLFISNVRVSGISLPFAFTGGEKVDRIVNCKLDLLNSGLMAIGSNEIDVTLVPPDPGTLPHYSMKTKIQAARPDGNSGLVFGQNNTVYLRAGENLPINQVRNRPPLKINGKGTVLHNETGLPIKLTKKSKNCKITTNGEVTDNGEDNEIKRID